MQASRVERHRLAEGALWKPADKQDITCRQTSTNMHKTRHNKQASHDWKYYINDSRPIKQHFHHSLTIDFLIVIRVTTNWSTDNIFTWKMRTRRHMVDNYTTWSRSIVTPPAISLVQPSLELVNTFRSCFKQMPTTGNACNSKPAAKCCLEKYWRRKGIRKICGAQWLYKEDKVSQYWG